MNEVATIVEHDLLPQMIEAHARDHGERIFLEQVEGELRQTYSETHARGLRWARAFRRLGVVDHDHVARFTPTCIESVNIWVGLGWLRATDVPINTDYRGAMLAAILENSEAEILVCANRWVEFVIAVADNLTHLKKIVVFDGMHRIPGDDRFEFIDAADILDDTADVDESFEGPQSRDIAMVVYSSGTTGVSKAAMLPWGNYAMGARNIVPPGDVLTSDDVLYLPYPLFHIAGTFWVCGMARAGGTVVLREVFSTSNFWTDVAHYSATVSHLLGATANFLYRQPEQPEDGDNTLRLVLMVPLLKDVRGFEKRFGLEAFTDYGMTELGVVMRSELSPPDPMSCGRPLPEFELRIVDSHDTELPIGEAGELVVRTRSPWIMSTGYFGMAEATAAAWQNLWFHTGDEFRRDETGSYHFIDRLKDTIRRRGENISSVEVESYVLRHDAVFECVAIAAPSEWGEDEVKLCIVPKEGREIQPLELYEFLVAADMPRFMLPRYIILVPGLPRTQTGKLQKHVIRKEHGNTEGWDRDILRPLAARGAARQ